MTDVSLTKETLRSRRKASTAITYDDEGKKKVGIFVDVVDGDVLEVKSKERLVAEQKYIELMQAEQHENHRKEIQKAVMKAQAEAITTVIDLVSTPEGLATLLDDPEDALKSPISNIEHSRGEHLQYLMSQNKTFGVGLSKEDKHRFIELIRFAPYGCNPLVYPDGTLLYCQFIAERIWKMDRSHASKLLKKFVQLDYLTTAKCNPSSQKEINYISTGKFILKGPLPKTEKFITKIYQNKLNEVIDRIQELYPAGRKQTSPLSVIFDAMKYFNFRTYYMVEIEDTNKDILSYDGEPVAEALLKQPDALRYLDRERLAEILTVDGRTLDKYVNMLRDAGAIIERVGNGTSTFVIHPDLMYRMNDNGMDPYTTTIRAEFAVQEAQRKAKVTKGKARK